MIALPAAVTLRLHGLEQAAEDARARVQSCLTLIERLEIDELNAQRRKQFAESNKDAESVAVEDAALAKIRSALDAAGADRMLRQDAQHASAHVYAKVKSWLEQLRPDRVLEPVAADELKPRRGESAGELVHRLQREIADVRAEIAQAALTPLPRAELKRLARENVAALARDAAPRLDPLTGKIVETYRTSQHDVLRLLCALVPSAVVNALDEQTASIPDIGESAGDKALRLKELKTKLDKLERVEEAAITAALAAGVICHRRHDANPAAILGVRVTKRTAAAQAAA